MAWPGGNLLNFFQPVANLGPIGPAQPVLLPIGQLTGGTGPPIPPALPLIPGDSRRAARYLKARLRDIHIHHPNHEMFLPIHRDRLSMDLHVAGRANAVCWYNAIDRMCNSINNGLVWGQNYCWMTRTNSYKITRQVNNRTELCKSFKLVRFFAFVMEPNDINWMALRDGLETRPFDHFCGRGELTDPAQNGYVCVNGVEHGNFSTRAINESRKSCKNGALVLCPGHGPNLSKCIFTAPTGIPRPCRNNPTQVPVCACNPNCY